MQFCCFRSLISKPIAFALKLFATFKTTPSPEPISTIISSLERFIVSKSLKRSDLCFGTYGAPKNIVKRKAAIIMPRINDIE